MHTFTPRMKIAPTEWNRPRLEIFHPRTVHIFSRGRACDGENGSNKLGTLWTSSAQADRAWGAIRPATHGTHDFASCCHAVFPTAPVRVSRRKSRPMCTFLKNRVRFASRAAHLTCTKNLTRATLCLRKMVHNDLHGCVYHSLSVVICTRCVLCGGFCRAMCGGFEFVVAVSPGRPPWNGTPGATNQGGVHHRAHFFAVLVGERVNKGAAIPRT